MMNNNMYQPNSFMPGTSYGNVQTAKMTQPLTKEEINELRKNENKFSIKLTPLEISKGICTHKDNGQITLMDNPDGTVTCGICGETFALVNKSPEEIEQITQEMVDIIQSIKTYYLDMPVGMAQEYFRILPLLKKIPDIYQFALKNFADHENPQMINQNNNMFGFGMYNYLMGGGTSQPQMNMNCQQPNMMGMQPQTNYQQSQQRLDNPFYGQQQPQMNMNSQQPNMMGNNMRQDSFYGQQQPQQQFQNQQPQQQFQNQQPHNQEQRKTIVQDKKFDIV